MIFSIIIVAHKDKEKGVSESYLYFCYLHMGGNHQDGKYVLFMYSADKNTKESNVIALQPSLVLLQVGQSSIRRFSFSTSKYWYHGWKYALKSRNKIKILHYSTFNDPMINWISMSAFEQYFFINMLWDLHWTC